MRHLPTVARLLLGLVFFGAGLTFFLLPMPSTPMPEGAGALAAALIKSGYLFHLVKVTEVAGGAMLLANRFVPLALALLAPIIVNIVAFHAVLAPSGLVVPIAIVGLEIYLAWAYRAAFLSMLAMRASPRLRAQVDAKK